MDLTFSEEELEFRDELREWLAGHTPGEEPRDDQDAAFAFRDFEAEARFLVDAWEKYGEGESKNLTSFLDVGAGTGRHGAALAKISTSPASSLSLFALDASAEMLSAASKAAEEAGCPPPS